MSASIRNRIANAGGRMPRNQPKDLVAGRGVFTGTTTNSATTMANLRISGGFRSAAVASRLGVTLPAANPAIVCLIERVGIMFHTGTELDSVIQNYSREMHISHGPVSDEPAKIDLSGYLTSTITPPGAGTVLLSGGFGAQVYKAPTFELLTPLLVNLETDTFECGPHTAVTGVAGLPFTIFVDGYFWVSKGYTRSEWIAALADDENDLATYLAERAQHNAIRGYRDGRVKGVKVNA